MKLVEIRDLDGPNIFLSVPSIKIEFSYESDSDLIEAADRISPDFPRTRAPGFRQFSAAANSWLESALRATTGAGHPIVEQLETPNHLAVVFTWSHRRFALDLAATFARVVGGEIESSVVDFERLRSLLTNVEADDRPTMIRDSERSIPVVGVTGTNGKTTTTRLIAHLVMSTGKHAGWSSSSGVYIDGVEVLHGDYSGPSGGRRVLLDPGVDVAILETARGGILLRGMAYESNDVSVFTNVSADHLDLQGIHTVEGLAAVKSIVVKVTRPGGTAVLNGDDPLVLTSTLGIAARKVLFSRRPESQVIADHARAGGLAVVADDNDVLLLHHEDRVKLISLSEIPVTFGGRALHMIENALAGIGAAIGLGMTNEEIANGLRSFHNSTDQNMGRLNVFDVAGVKVVMDFAHNEVGLGLLIEFSRKLSARDGRVMVVIGTAGDRTDQSLMEIGRTAADEADRVLVKDTEKYLRGRTNEELIGLFQAGIRSTGRPDAEVCPDEISGMHSLLAEAQPGDVVAIMCHEQTDEICSWLKSNGQPFG